jgi:hypothetical protein
VLPLSRRRGILLVALAASSLVPSRARAADPTTGDCLTASETAIKLRSDHKLRAAREQFLVCSNASCPADVRSECAHRVESLSSAIPTVVFEAKDGAGNDLASVKVTLDGAPLVDRLEGTAISLDPGEHTFRFEAPGQAPIERVLVIREGEKDRRERMVFAPPAPSEPAPHADQVDVTQEMNGSDGRTQRIAGVAVAGVGVVGAVLGVIFGVEASSSWSMAESACGKSCAPTSPAVGDLSTARTDAAVSTVGFVAAGVGLAAGALLFFTAPHMRAAATPIGLAPAVGPGGGGLVLGGRW